MSEQRGRRRERLKKREKVGTVFTVALVVGAKVTVTAAAAAVRKDEGRKEGREGGKTKTRRRVANGSVRQ